MCFTSPELRSASSYGHFTAAKEFRSQCHILGFEPESRPAGAFGADKIVFVEPERRPAGGTFGQNI